MLGLAGERFALGASGWPCGQDCTMYRFLDRRHAAEQQIAYVSIAHHADVTGERTGEPVGLVW